MFICFVLFNHIIGKSFKNALLGDWYQIHEISCIRVQTSTLEYNQEVKATHG